MPRARRGQRSNFNRTRLNRIGAALVAPITNQMAIIKTKKGVEIIVDDSNYEWLSKFKWHISSVGYARRNHRVDGKQFTVLMHREIMNTPAGYDTDHINGVKTDNRRCNLRVCTRSENQANRRAASNNKTRLKGVSKSSRVETFRAEIKANGKHIYLGSFCTPEEAHKSYIAASLKYHGAFSPYATGRQR